MRASLQILLVTGLLLLFGCGSSTSSQNGANERTSEPNKEATFSAADPIPLSAGIPPIEPECDQDQSAVITQLDNQRLDGNGMFPYVYQGVGRTTLLEAYTMRFQLCYDALLVPMSNMQTPWVNPEVYNENNGNFVTYVRQGRDVSMSSPHIMVQYLNKALPYCGSVDSIFMWLDETFTKDPTTEVITKATSIQTLSGKSALCKEYYIGKGDGTRLPKWVSYAYIDYDDDYIIGMALTTTVKTDFPINRPLFFKMVRSFNYF